MPTFAIIHVDDRGRPRVVFTTEDKDLAHVIFDWLREKIKGVITLKSSEEVKFHD